MEQTVRKNPATQDKALVNLVLKKMNIVGYVDLV